MTTLRFEAGLWAVLAWVSAVCLWGHPLPAKERSGVPPRKAHVFVYPVRLTGKDKLKDGNDGKVMEIKSETMLVWVDLMPDARFAHDTEYVLVSAEGSRVVKGQWRPVLNGKELFHQSTQPSQVDFPVTLPAK